MRRVSFLIFFWLIASFVVADETITASGTTWVPSDITILPGESVTWNWSSGHTSTSTTGNNCIQSAGPDAWDFSTPGNSKTFNNVGNFNFMCTPHCESGMKGIVRVVDFDVSCNPAIVGSQQNGDGTTTCTVTSLNGFAFSVILSTIGLPAGVTQNFSVNPITPPATSSTLTLTVDNTVAEGSYPFTLVATATSGSSTPGTRTKNFNMTLNVTGVPLFIDTFDDTDNTGWIFTKGTWSSPAGALIGSFAKKAFALAPYIMCSDCRVEGDLNSAGGDFAQVSLHGWFLDKKNNVELLMKQQTGRWVLKRKINGLTVLKAKAIMPISPNVTYHAAISYNGTAFEVYIDGNLVITTAPISPPPAGNPGFKVKATTGTFDEIAVYQ